jgi:hypothetical protein
MFVKELKKKYEIKIYLKYVFKVSIKSHFLV